MLQYLPISLVGYCTIHQEVGLCRQLHSPDNKSVSPFTFTRWQVCIAKYINPMAGQTECHPSHSSVDMPVFPMHLTGNQCRQLATAFTRWQEGFPHCIHQMAGRFLPLQSRDGRQVTGIRFVHYIHQMAGQCDLCIHKMANHCRSLHSPDGSLVLPTLTTRWLDSVANGIHQSVRISLSSRE